MEHQQKALFLGHGAAIGSRNGRLKKYTKGYSPWATQQQLNKLVQVTKRLQLPSLVVSTLWE